MDNILNSNSDSKSETVSDENLNSVNNCNYTKQDEINDNSSVYF